MKLALTAEERQRLVTQGVIQQPATERIGRPRKASFADEKPVCKARGCFNYVEHKEDSYCPRCEARSAQR